MTTSAFAQSGHSGLLGMHEWADLIGGRLEVQSEAGAVRDWGSADGTMR